MWFTVQYSHFTLYFQGKTAAPHTVFVSPLFLLSADAPPRIIETVNARLLNRHPCTANFFFLVVQRPPAVQGLCAEKT